MKKTWSEGRIGLEFPYDLWCPRLFSRDCAAKEPSYSLGGRWGSRSSKAWVSCLLCISKKELVSTKRENKCQLSLLAGPRQCVLLKRKAFLRVRGKVAFPVFGTCPCGSVSNSKNRLIPACFAWPAQADNAFDTCTVCSLTKTEKLNHSAGHLCCSQDSEGFNLT